MILFLWISLVFAALVTIAGAQQPLPPLNYQEMLERSLTRERQQTSLCTQQYEDTVKYFQGELRKVMEELATERKKSAVPEVKPGEGK